MRWKFIGGADLISPFRYLAGRGRRWCEWQFSRHWRWCSAFQGWWFRSSCCPILLRKKSKPPVPPSIRCGLLLYGYAIAFDAILSCYWPVGVPAPAGFFISSSAIIISIFRLFCNEVLSFLRQKLHSSLGRLYIIGRKGMTLTLGYLIT